MAKGQTKKQVVKTGDTLLITNHMRCAWVVPPELLPSQTKKDVGNIEKRRELFSRTQKIIAPNSSVDIDKEAFGTYYKNATAFRAMIDQKYLVVEDKKIPVEMLKSVNEASVPIELTNNFNKEAVVTTNKNDLTPDKMEKVVPVKV